ncbi:hypothetical protein HZA99_04420, partial [Candidatus Woesearchaeota archaeon]|nr:hypothetical protein [Candidatus Woesearchaeota archaeon]
LSQKHLPLALAEARALYGTANVTASEEYAFVKHIKETKGKPLYQKLAFTKAVYEILFSCSRKELENRLRKYPWNKTIIGAFCVRSSVDERKLAGIIWDALKKKTGKDPHVDLAKPDTLIHFFFIKNKVFATKQLWQNLNSFLERKAQHRPGFYPASLHPQLALGMVHLSGASGTIVDPFCGTGGILIEAGLSGCRCAGFDISKWMLEKCHENLKYYGIKNIIVQHGDATTFRKKCAAIVTELPFGKNTKSQDFILLYTRFLENASRNTSIVVVSFPDFVDYKKICRATNWKIVSDFQWYLHASLSKHVVVLKRMIKKNK